MGRKKRIFQSNYAYHIIMHASHDLCFPLEIEECRKRISSAINQAAENNDIHIYHIAVMSNHIHMIVKTPNENMNTFMHAACGMIATRMNKLYQLRKIITHFECDFF